MKELFTRSFLLLFLAVYSALIYNFYTSLSVFIKKPTPPQRVLLHNMVVFSGLVHFAKNEHELAAVIAHEFAHLELQHTVMDKHDFYREYNADQLSVYYMLKAGYSPCGASEFWKRMSGGAVTLSPKSHPLRLSRQHYMKLPMCDGVELKTKKLTNRDVYRVYNKIAKNVETRIRYKTKFKIMYLPLVNAYVNTEMENTND